MRKAHQKAKVLIAEIAAYLDHDLAKQESLDTLKDLCKVVHDETEKHGIRFIRIV
jgi:hypothetical protein